MMVRPLLFIAPPDQSSVPVMVTSPKPFSVPEEKFTLVRLIAPAKPTVLPLKFNWPAVICAPAANVWLPPVTLTVPNR